MILIGFCSAGKSEVGKRMATLLQKEHFDSDREIERECHQKVCDVFQEMGEENFRLLEQKVIFNLLKKNDIILSTGGGAILLEESRLALKKTKKVVYLKAQLKTLLARMEQNNRFPKSFCDKDIVTLAEYRFSLYEATADFIIETDDLSIDQVALNIIKKRLPE